MDLKQGQNSFVFPIEYLRKIQSVSKALQNIKEMPFSDDEIKDTENAEDVRIFYNETGEHGVYTV